MSTAERTGIIPVPSLPDTMRTLKTAVRVGIVEVPRECMEEIVVNPYAYDVLAPKVRFLATDTWLARAAVCATQPDHAAHTVLSPRSWNRAVPIAYGRIPYEGMLGSVVMAKGVNVAGFLMTQKPNLQAEFIDDSPVGYFGDRDAKNETDISNALISSGFRASLTLGYIVLNNNTYRSFLKNHDPHAYYAYMLRNLDMVRSNGDRPVIMFRVVGTKERYSSDRIFESPEQKRGDMVYGTRLMLEEARRPKSFMHDSLGLIKKITGNWQMVRSLTTLTAIAGHMPLPPTAQDDMMHIMAAIDAKNALAAGKARIASADFDPKDTDCAHFQTDFESTRMAGSIRSPITPLVYLDRITYGRALYINTVTDSGSFRNTQHMYERLAGYYLSALEDR